MRDKAVFTIAYNGPALEDGTMDVRELAPALMSLGSLIDEANRIINNDQSKIQVKVKADFKAGSFEISIEIIKTLLEQLFNTYNADIKELLKTLGLISGFSGITLLELFKTIKGRKIEKVKQHDKNNVEIIYVDNSTTTIINNNVYNMFINTKTQEAVQGVVRPLKKDGIIDFYTIEDQGGNFPVKINQNDLPYYVTPDFNKDKDNTNIKEFTYTGSYRVITAQFEDKYKWRLTNGQDRVTAHMRDLAFMDKIDKNEVAIAKGDTLILELRTTQWEDPDGELKAENEITRVIEYKKALQQLKIPFEYND